MQIRSLPPHDFYMALDVDEYFHAEDDPEDIAQNGLVRPLNLADRSVLAVIHYNNDPLNPAFDVDLPEQDPPTSAEEAELTRLVGRILGTNIDVAGFHQKVQDDPVLGPIANEFLGFKRLSRSCFFEDATRQIIRTRISHEPTRRRMVQDVRRAWGTAFQWRGQTYYSFPRPADLAAVEPAQFRTFGISQRKGEYVLGLARAIAQGELDQWALEAMNPRDFWDAANAIRGIGPATAQSLMFRRNRPDGHFFSQRTRVKKTSTDANQSAGSKKKDKIQPKTREVGYRCWVLGAYGLNPDTATDADYEKVRDHWRGYEALAWHYLFYNWLMQDKAQAHAK